ncbi:MAG: Ig-like domain-containing protein, partial [Clostridia bacterium]|nr:Ig-like domain-containing protein [Clostridia bacterium]
IYNEEGVVIEGGLELNAPMQLYCDIAPMDALDYQNFNWTSSDSSVVRVSGNGFITPLARGNATVSVNALDKKGNMHSAELQVNTENALVKAVKIKTSTEISIDWIKSNLLLSSSAEVSATQEGSYIVSENGLQYILSVSHCDYDEALFSAALSTLYTQNGPYYLELHYADVNRNGQIPQATFEVSDPTVLQLDTAKNMIIPLRAGSAQLIAHYNGSTVTTSVTVKERPYAFNLLYTDSDAQLGIQRSRIWAGNWLTQDNTYINTLQFGSSLSKEQADIKWETDNPDYATIDQDALITFYPESAGNTVTVRGTVLVNNYATNIYREFKFNMTDNAAAVNVYNFEQFKFVAEKTTDDLVMQNNITAASPLNIRSSIYGNGFLYDFRGGPDIGSQGIFCVKGDRLDSPDRKLIYEDLWVEAAEDIEQSANRGMAFHFKEVVNPIEIKYCILQYCHSGIYFHLAKNVLVEGCILGYSANNSVEIKTDVSTDAFFTFRNNVMRQSGGPSIIISVDKFVPEYFDRNMMPNIKIEGFFDVTNWKTPDDLRGLLGGIDPNLMSGVASFLDPDKLIDSITSIIEDLFSRDDMQFLLYTSPLDGQKYVCMGIFALGLYVKPDKKCIQLGDTSLVTLPVVFPKDSSPVGFLAQTIDAVSQQYLDMTIYHPNYLVSYDFSDGKKPKYGPGESIPQNFELYARLVNGDS